MRLLHSEKLVVLAIIIVTQIFGIEMNEPTYTHIPKPASLSFGYYSINVTSGHYPGGERDGDSVIPKWYNKSMMNLQIGLPWQMQAELRIVDLKYKLFSGGFRWNVWEPNATLPVLTIGMLNLGAEYGDLTERNVAGEKSVLPIYNSHGFPFLWGESKNSAFLMLSQNLAVGDGISCHLGWGTGQFQAQGGLAKNARGLFFGVDWKINNYFLVAEFDGVKAYLGGGWIPTKDIAITVEIRAIEDIMNNFRYTTDSNSWIDEYILGDGMAGFVIGFQFSSFFDTRTQKENYNAIYPVQQEYIAELSVKKKEAQKIETAEQESIEQLEGQIQKAKSVHMQRLAAIREREAKLWADFNRQKEILLYKKDLLNQAAEENSE